MIKKLFRFIFDVVHGARKDDIGAFSAQSAFFMTISVIPFIMLLISIIKFLPVSQEQLLALVVEVFPGGAKNLIASFIEETFQKSDAAVISITAVYTLWVASMGVFSVAKGLNRVFCSDETRGYFHIRIMSMFYTLGVLVMFVLCLILFVFGNTTTEILHITISNSGVAILIMGMRKVIGILFLSLFFLFLYVIVPNRKAKLITQIPGALVSGFGWVGFSYVFSLYYDNMANFSFLYGSLSVMVFFMLWLFVCFYILFIGAEINKWTEKQLEKLSLMKK